MVILERRNNAGKISYKTLEEAWQGSKEDNFILLDLLDQLRTDPGLLSSETVLADLNDELAPVSPRPFWLPKNRVNFLCGPVTVIHGELFLFLNTKARLLHIFMLMEGSSQRALKADSAQGSV